jgi:phosphoglycolate phosphatase
MNHYKHLIFDLDGTLVDSRKGIINSLSYTAGEMNFKLASKVDINDLIGPPLNEIFRKGYNVTEDLLEKAVTIYREHYNNVGIYISELYPGTKELLQKLKDSNKILYIATSKGQPYAEKVLDIHGIRHFFNLVIGSNQDFSISTKSSMINLILEKENIKDKTKIVMIGDRSHDMIGANHQGIAGIGILWGYGSIGELSVYNPEFIINDHEELLKLLLN